MAIIVAALRAELAALEAELAADPRYQKITKIRELIAIYEGASQAAPEQITAISRQAPRPRGTPAANSLTGRVIEAATAHFRQTGRRAQTSEITAAVVAAGAPLPESVGKQRDFVSSILSHSSLFNNVRGEGYGLAEWPTEPQRPANHDGNPAPVETQQRLLSPRPNGEIHAGY